MNKLNLTAIAFAMALPVTMSAQASSGVHEASADMTVSAVINDMIAIKNLPPSIQIDLNNADNEGTWWFKHIDFTVLRSGPSNDTSHPFDLTVSGEYGGTTSSGSTNTPMYALQREGGDVLPMMVRVNDGHGDHALIHGKSRGFRSSLSMEDKDKKNMAGSFGILQEDIMSSPAGTYSAKLIFKVAAK